MPPKRGSKDSISEEQPAPLPASALPCGPSPHSPGMPIAKCQIGEQPWDPARPLPAVNPKHRKQGPDQIFAHRVQSSIFTTARSWKRSKWPWMDERTEAHPYNGVLYSP